MNWWQTSMVGVLVFNAAFIPFWIYLKRRDRAYEQRTRWQADYLDYKRFADGLQHPLGETVETARDLPRLGVTVSTDKLVRAL